MTAPAASAPRAGSRGTARTPGTAPRGAVRTGVVVTAGLALLALLAVVSLYVGSGDIPAADVTRVMREFLTHGTRPTDTTGMLVLERRLPRMLIAIAVGSALGMAGAVMQTLTRNPLADPGLLGVSSGAYFAVVITSAFIGVSVGQAHVWAAMAGALVSSVLVYVIGTTGFMAGNAVKLVLAGVAFGAVVQGASSVITLSMPDVFDRVRFWSSGSLQGRSTADLQAVLPFLLVGAVIAVLMPRALNALGLGDDTAVALGSRPAATRVVGLAAITLLTGAATAAAGPLSFVGLIVPHALRMLVGPDHRKLLPLACLAAPVLLLAADILARVVVASELPTGTVTALIGAPVLIWLIRGRTVKGL